MRYLILALIIIIVVPSYIEVKIRNHYGIPKRTLKNRFVNKTHKIVFVSTLLILIVPVSEIFNEFRGAWIIIIVAAFIIDMFFELRYRKESKLYILGIFSFLIIIGTFISVTAYLS